MVLKGLSYLVSSANKGNGRSLSGMGLTRERRCCARVVEQARHEHMLDEYKTYIMLL